MAILISNISVSEGIEYKAGAKRMLLRVYSNVPLEANKPIHCKISYYKDDRESFIKIQGIDNPPAISEPTIGFGFFSAYNVSLFQSDVAIFVAKSQSALQAGVIILTKPGLIVKVHSYKDRRPAEYFIFTTKGWVRLGTKSDILASESDEAREVIKKMGWTTIDIE